MKKTKVINDVTSKVEKITNTVLKCETEQMVTLYRGMSQNYNKKEWGPMTFWTTDKKIALAYADSYLFEIRVPKRIVFKNGTKEKSMLQNFADSAKKLGLNKNDLNCDMNMILRLRKQGYRFFEGYDILKGNCWEVTALRLIEYIGAYEDFDDNVDDQLEDFFAAAVEPEKVYKRVGKSWKLIKEKAKNWARINKLDKFDENLDPEEICNIPSREEKAAEKRKWADVRKKQNEESKQYNAVKKEADKEIKELEKLAKSKSKYIHIYSRYRLNKKDFVYGYAKATFEEFPIGSGVKIRSWPSELEDNQFMPFEKLKQKLSKLEYAEMNKQ